MDKPDLSRMWETFINFEPNIRCKNLEKCKPYSNGKPSVQPIYKGGLDKQRTRQTH
jgi:hypothetical protein